MSRELITVDIDDVFADSTESFRLAVNQHTGANLTSADYRVPHTSYNRYYEHVWKKHGLEVAYDEVSTQMHVDQSHVPLVSGADVALKALSKYYDLEFITSRPAEWEAATQLYMSGKLDGLVIKTHFTEKREGLTKGQICRELGASWHIDDNPDHCQSVIDEGIGAILFGEYGWHYKIPDGAVHCKDWPAVLEYFDGRG